MILYRFAARLTPGNYKNGPWRRWRKNAVKDGIAAAGYADASHIVWFCVTPLEWLRGRPSPPRN